VSIILWPPSLAASQRACGGGGDVCWCQSEPRRNERPRLSSGLNISSPFPRSTAFGTLTEHCPSVTACSGACGGQKGEQTRHSPFNTLSWDKEKKKSLKAKHLNQTEQIWEREGDRPIPYHRLCELMMCCCASRDRVSFSLCPYHPPPPPPPPSTLRSTNNLCAERHTSVSFLLALSCSFCCQTQKRQTFLSLSLV